MQPGDLIEERFALECVAGSGGMGQVYRALDLQSGKTVAIKAIHAREGDDALRFVREAKILAELHHPQIVRHILHGSLPSGELFLAMEWLAGEDLAQRLSKGRLDTRAAVTLAVGIANALGFAHSKGIVHRDLKPSNVYLVDGALDSVKLLDFGIAQLDRASRMTRTGMLIGTPAYMAPEQARGDAKLDSRADIFSLGCVLFECLVGEPAFSGATVIAVLAKILFDEPPSAQEKLPTIPRALSNLIAQMMAKNPEERPSDGASVARLLQAQLDNTNFSQDERVSVQLPHPEALTGSEQRAVATILMSAPAQDIGQADTILMTSSKDEEASTTLRAQANAHGGGFERLLDGSIAVVLMSTNLVTDLAAQAARCALAFESHRSGRAIAIAIGRGERTGRVPMGPAMDRAAKLIDQIRQTKDGGPILLDERMAGLLDARFDVRECDFAFSLHGEREEAVETRTLLGKATPCVGREWELRSLEGLFNDCVEEPAASAVLITAIPGRGKSRLVYELLRAVRSRDEPVLVWVARGDSLRAGSAFGLLGQALRGACGIRDGEALALRRQRLATKVEELVAPAERPRVVEFLGELLGVPAPENEESAQLNAARRDAQLMFEHMREAFLTFLRGACAAATVLILLEDLHWGDRPTVQFLDRALRDLGNRPLFVLAAARPEVHEVFPKLWAGRRMQEFQLKELGRKAMERLARHVLGEAVDKDTVDRLARLSEGNALYLEELIRRAAEGRSADLPETLVAMVQSRLHALDDDSRRILRAASVFGEVFWVSGVASLLGGETKEDWTDARLGDLFEKELIVKRGERRFPGQRELAFRHALLREAAYTMLTDQDRRLGHRLAGEWLEKHGEQDMLALAEHFERGSDDARAGRYYLLAAEQAFAAGDAGGALKQARRGLACVVATPLRIRLLGIVCETTIWYLEALPGAEADARELLRVAEHGTKPWFQGALSLIFRVIQLGKLNELDDVLRMIEEAPSRSETAGLLTHGFVSGIIALDGIGRLQQGSQMQKRLEPFVRSFGANESLVSILWHGICALRNASAHKDPWSALVHGRTAVTLARNVGHPRLAAVAQTYLGMIQWFLGAATECEETLRELPLPEEELGLGASRRSFSLAWMHADRGATGDAMKWASRLRDAGMTRKVNVFEALGRWVLGEALRRSGEHHAADTELQTALGLLDASSALERPGILASIAALRLAQGNVAEALSIAEDATSHAKTMGGCSRFFRDAFLLLTHAECVAATGDHVGAQEHFIRAKSWVMMVAAKIEDPTYRTLFLTQVPENRRILELALRYG